MTHKQAQNLLSYLGYYTLTYGKTGVTAIDGDWGKKSQEACKAFQADFGLQVTGQLDADTEKALRHAVAYGMPDTVAKPGDGVTNEGQSGTFWDDLKYFRREESGIRCPCSRCGGFPAEPTEKLMRVAEQIREHFGAPMLPSSTVRCQAHNDELPGSAKNSRHLSGKAMDFRIQGKPGATVLAYTKKLQSQGVIRYTYQMSGTEYVHIDVD